MDNEQISHIGRSVIEIEAAMISQLKDRIDANFISACHYLHDCSGRIIVMGMGKSGHIGKKIAATFASTGSPAFFIHPSEAKHGDMGMITGTDVVLLLSNSGESEEIISILPAIKRLAVPVIALTGRPHSTLAKNASISLDVSVQKEACPLGLAPTSSTTATLVMGDALAMVLLEKRRFTKKDFALSHPGGALGRRLLLTVDHIMHKDEALPMVRNNSSLKEAVIEMTKKKLGMTTVINEDDKLVGVLTDGDLRRIFEKNIDIQNIIMESIMCKNPKTITDDILAAEALNIMEQFQITSLIITDPHTKPIGIIHIHDILRAGVV